MVNLETYQRRRPAVDYRKCAAVAAVLSALIVGAVELTGGPVAPASAKLSAPAKTVTGQ